MGIRSRFNKELYGTDVAQKGGIRSREAKVPSSLRLRWMSGRSLRRE